MNRNIKEEFGINRKLKTKNQAVQLVKESIYLYNTKRPHLSLRIRHQSRYIKMNIPTTKCNRDSNINLSTYFGTIPSAYFIDLV